MKDIREEERFTLQESSRSGHTTRSTSDRESKQCYANDNNNIGKENGLALPCASADILKTQSEGYCLPGRIGADDKKTMSPTNLSDSRCSSRSETTIMIACESRSDIGNCKRQWRKCEGMSVGFHACSKTGFCTTENGCNAKENIEI